MDDDLKRLLEQMREENAAARVALEDKIERTAADTQAMIKFSHAELDRRIHAMEERAQRLERAMADLEARIERLESPTQ